MSTAAGADGGVGPSDGGALAYSLLDLGRALVLISGGEKVGDEELLAKARDSIRAGATGVIFGRNVWQRPYEQAIGISRQISKMLVDASTDG